MRLKPTSISKFMLISLFVDFLPMPEYVGYLVVNWACNEMDGIEQGAALKGVDVGPGGVIIL